MQASVRRERFLRNRIAGLHSFRPTGAHCSPSRRWFYVLALGLILASCSPTATKNAGDYTNGASPPASALEVETSGYKGGTLRYALAGPPSTFNPAAAADARSKLIAYLTHANLLELDALDQQVVDGITVSHDFSRDGRSLRLTFRKGLRYSDGEPFQVEDVLFTFEKIYEKDSANVLKDSLLFDGKALQVEQTGEDEVLITFPEPYAAAEFVLTTIPVLPAHLFPADGRKLEEYWGLDAEIAQLAGLGPFRISSHRPSERVTLQANPYYWKVDSQGQSLPYLEEVVVEYIPDRNNQLLRLQSSQLDLIDTLLRPEDLRLLEDDPRLKTVNAGPSGNLLFLWFNQNTGQDPDGTPYLSGARRDWFTNAAFRRAISYAVNRSELQRNVFLGQASPAFSLLPPGFERWQVTDLERTDGDLKAAEAALREAGFQWQKGEHGRQLLDHLQRPVAFELLTRSDEVMGRTAAMIQQDLEALGMSVSLRQEEARSVISRAMGSRRYDSVLLSLEFPLDPADYMNVFLSSSPMHMWNPMQKEPATEWEGRIDELMRKQAREVDPGVRFTLFAEVQRILSREKPVIPLLSRDILVAYRPDLHNVRPANLFPYALWNVWELSHSSPPR